MYPKEADPNGSFTIVVSLKGESVNKAGKLMLGMHTFSATGERRILGQTWGRRNVIAGRDAELAFDMKLPDRPDLAWVSVPVWISRDGEWQPGNPLATEVHVAKHQMASKRPVRKVRLDVALPDTKQPGLYYALGERADFCFRRRGRGTTEGINALSVRIEEEEGDFAWQTEVPFDGRVSDAIQVRLPRIGYYHLRIDIPKDVLLED